MSQLVSSTQDLAAIQQQTRYQIPYSDLATFANRLTVSETALPSPAILPSEPMQAALVSLDKLLRMTVRFRHETC
jgi:hypothetical protein